MGEPGLKIVGHLLKSRLAVAAGDITAARAEIDRALAEGPTDRAALEARCQILFEHGSPVMAEEAVRALVKHHPDDASGHHNLGTLLLRLKRYDEAAQSLRQALRHRADAPATYLHLGYALKESGRIDEAVAAWQQVLRLAPDDSAAREELRLAARSNEAGERRAQAYALAGTVRYSIQTAGGEDRGARSECAGCRFRGQRDAGRRCVRGGPRCRKMLRMARLVPQAMMARLMRRIQDYLDQLRQRGEPLPISREEWDRFFQLHSPFLLRLVRSHHWSTEDCEDGVQELWLLLLTRLPDLRYNPCRGEIRCWISTLARHWLVDQDRYRRIHLTKRLRSEAVDQLAGRELDPAAAIERIQLAERVREALAEVRMRVSERDYEAFTLRWLDGLSVREIARRLGRTEAQVWSSHHRMRRKLRPLLARWLEPGPRVIK